MFKPVIQKLPPAPKPNIDRINSFKGINVSVDPTQLEYNESPDMLNMTLDTEGALDKRTGYAKLFATPLSGTVWSEFTYRKLDDTVEYLLHAGTNLYRMPLDGIQPTSIYASLANSRSNMFAMNGKVYIQDGTNYLEYDGATVHEPTPYVPTLFISTPHEGGGTAFEDANLLTPKFKQSFSPDGVKTAYQMAVTGLDAAPVIGSFDGVNFNKVETTDFTVNRATGVITTTTAVTKGTNTVIFQAEKLVAGNKQKISKCKNARMFGGTNDTRVFMWDGNILYRSDIYRPNYFPENAYQKIGGDDDIQNMVIQYDSAVIEKEFSKWSLRYDDSTGKALFPVRPINDTVGSIAPLSSQLIENAPVTLTRNGVYTLAGGSVRDERNVQQISKRIDKLLLAEPNLKNAITIDFDQKYMIFLNSKVYVWDYRLNEWYPWDNFPATSVWEIDSRLHFGDSAGNVYVMKKAGEYQASRDVDKAIIHRWKSKQMSFGMDGRRKLVEKLFLTIKPSTSTSTRLSYITDVATSSQVVNPNIRMDLFDFNNMDFNRFSFITSSLPQTTAAKIKAKKVVYFQVVLDGDSIDDSLGVLSIEIMYSLQSLVK